MQIEAKICIREKLSYQNQQSSFSLIANVGNVVQYCAKWYNNIFIIFFEICNWNEYF